MSVDRVDNIKDAPERALSRVIGHASDGKGGAATLENLKEQLAITAADVSGAVSDTRQVATENGIQGGGPLDGDLTLSLTDTGVSAGAYGSASAVPVITVDAQGRVTAAEEVEVEVPASGVVADTYGSATEIPVITVGADGRVSEVATAAIISSGDMVNVLDYGADPSGLAFSQDAIQAAINDAYNAGGGIIFIPAGTYRIGKSAETYPSTYVPVGSTCYYGLVVYSGVVLMGEGRATVLKRDIDDPLMMVICPNGFGTQVRNLLIDGNATGHPYVGDTYGSGGGIGVESTSGTDDRETVIDTVWIRDTPGYGVGVEWGNHRGCTLRNIFIDGTGSDGVDVKRMNSGLMDAYAITLDNIHVTNFGQWATDAALQAGVDIRGYTIASNIHVWGVWGSRATAGMRIHADGGGVIGGNYASVTNFYIERTSGGGASTYGALNNGGRYGAFSNGSARSCHYNFGAFGLGGIFSVCRSVAALTAGFIDADTAYATRYIGCSAEGTTIGFYIAGDNAELVSPYTTYNATGISIASTAGKTALIYPTYSSNTADLSDSGTATSVITGASIGGGVGTTLQIDVSSAGGSWISAVRGSNVASIIADGTDADIDINIAPKAGGFHQFGNAKTATTVGAAGGASAPPANPVTYLRVKVAGVIRKIPLYTD